MGAVLCPHPVRGEPSIQRHTKRWQQTIHCKIFAQTGFLLEMVQLKLMMSHLQQLFTLHWDRRLRQRLIMITAYTSKGVRWIFPGVGEIMVFPWSGRKKFSRGPTVVKFDFINSKLREKHFLNTNIKLQQPRG